MESTILIAPHHGAQTESSSSGEILNWVKPRYEVFSASLYSQFNPPHLSAVKTAVEYFKKQTVDDNKNTMLDKYHFIYLSKQFPARGIEDKNNIVLDGRMIKSLKFQTDCSL